MLHLLLSAFVKSADCSCLSRSLFGSNNLAGYLLLYLTPYSILFIILFFSLLILFSVLILLNDFVLLILIVLQMSCTRAMHGRVV